MANINTRTQMAIKPQTLTGGTTYYNGSETTSTSAIGLHVAGKPSVAFSIGTVGASCTGISVQALTYETFGITPTAVNIEGASYKMLTASEGLQTAKIDAAIDRLESIVVSMLPIGDDVVAGANVIGLAENDSEADGR